MNEQLSTVDGRPVLRMQRRLRHPQQKVWRAITTPEHLAEWFPFAVELELQLDAKITFIEHDGSGPSSNGVITELDPPRLFAFSWGEDLLRWELHPDGDGCILTLTHTFDDRAGAASFASGWHTCIQALDASLDGRTMPLPQTMPEMAELHEARIKQFGLDQGTAEQTADGWQIRFERQLTAPIDAVWSILTGSSEPTVGATPPPAVTTDHFPPGAVTTVEAPNVLEYASESGSIRWELRDGTGHGARLVLTHTVPSVTDRDTALTAWRDRIEHLAAQVAP